MEPRINVSQKTTTIVCNTLAVENITIDKDLFESGLLDSMSLMQLLFELEERFEITIPPEELNVDDYRTIRSMSKMIERLLNTSVLIENEK